MPSPNPRPAKIRESCNNCGISKVKCGRQRPTCLPCLERGLACSYSPSRRSITNGAAYSESEASRSTTVADTFFDSFLLHCPSTIDTGSSPVTSPRHHVNPTHSSSQVMSVSPTDHVRLSHATASTKHMDGVGKTKSSTDSAQRFGQHATGAGPSDFRSETVLGPRSQPVFDTLAEKNLSSGSAADVDVQGHGTSGQELPVTAAYESDLIGEFDFDAICAAMTPSTFLAYMPKDLRGVGPEQNATAAARNSVEFCAGTGDSFPGIFSPVPNYRLNSRESQDTLMRIESCSDNGRTCMISALKVLQALHIPPSACLSACDEISMPSPRQPRMTDSVLSSNRDAIRLVSDILKCSCSLTSHVQLVLTTICSKLIAWYRAMIRNDYGGRDNSSSMLRSTINNDTDDEDHVERVLHQPITVGEHSFDVALESKIRAQVVFCELQHMDFLVESLSRRIQEATFGNLGTAAAARNGRVLATHSGPLAMDEIGLAEAVHRRLITFLHKQLQIAKAETNPILSDKHDVLLASRESLD